MTIIDVQDARGEIFARRMNQFDTVRTRVREYVPGAVVRVRHDTRRAFGRYADEGEWVVLAVRDTPSPRVRDCVTLTLRRLAPLVAPGGYVRPRWNTGVVKRFPD